MPMNIYKIERLKKKCNRVFFIAAIGKRYWTSFLPCDYRLNRVETFMVATGQEEKKPAVTW
jgi:hypothetical protein